MEATAYSTVKEICEQINGTKTGEKNNKRNARNHLFTLLSIDVPNNFGLYYSSNGREMLMEPERCLLFFRLSSKEHLIYQTSNVSSYQHTLETILKGTSVI